MCSSRAVCAAAGAVGLVHDQDVGDLEQTGLGGLNRVARTGIENDDGRIGDRGDLDLGLPDADRLQQDQAVAERAEQPDRRGHGGGEPAEVPAGGDRADQDAGVVDMRRHSDAVAQERTPE